MLFYGRCHISSDDTAVVQVSEVLDVGQHIAAVIRGRRNGVAGQVDQPQLLKLPQIHDIVKGRNVVATCNAQHVFLLLCVYSIRASRLACIVADVQWYPSTHVVANFTLHI